MPQLFNYHIFISHAWKYGDEYNRLVNLLDNAPYFSYCNYSAPEDKPLHNLDATDVTTKSQIMAAIDWKIKLSSCVLVISGMYYNHRKWMQYEIETAQRMGRPIIAVRPWGAERTPVEVSSVATEIVNWNTTSIVDAIRRHTK